MSSILLPALLTVMAFRIRPGTCEVSSCYPEPHVCPFNESDSISGVVTPTLPPPESHCNPNGTNCQLLECYLTCLIDTTHDREGVSLYFLPGIHRGNNLEAYVSSISGLRLVGIVDHGRDDPTMRPRVNDFKLIVKTQSYLRCEGNPPSIYMDSVIASNVDIVAHCYLGAPCNTEIANSVFNGASVVISNAIVSLYNLLVHNSTTTAFTFYFSRVLIEGKVSFVNNTGTNGGALALIGSLFRFSFNDVSFRNNRALQHGGGMYVESTDELGIVTCFYGVYVDWYSNQSVMFEDNSARVSGDHIYGVSMKSTCLDYLSNVPSYQIVRKKYIEFSPSIGETISGVSGSPSRVCICKDRATPQCANPANIVNQEMEIYPGEPFTIDGVVVGGDFGTTVGTVYASIEIVDNFTDYDPEPILEAPFMYSQVISNTRECTKLQYTVLSNTTGITLMLVLRTTESTTSTVPDNITGLCHRYNDEQVILPELINTPVVIPLAIRSCPAGFILKQDTCDCYEELYSTLSLLTCSIQDGRGYVSWNGSEWLGGTDKGNDTNGIAYSRYCPIDYCNTTKVMIDLQNDPHAQCAFSHYGRLCGACQDNYSLAIGSSRCIYCPNNNGLSLLIFFAAAGFLLIAVICTLNLTITEGTVNGLIFYANVVWAYQHVLFPQNMNGYLVFLRVFVAWLNLDFGIESCFISGLTAFWKTWLQFIFPIYTAGIFFICLRYSNQLSKLLGGRSQHTFATLFFLSNTKFLRTIISALTLAEIETYPAGSHYYVWAADGTLEYGHFPHIILLLVAIVCLVLFWIPYALLLFSMQWLRRVDHRGPLKYINKQKPLIDAHFAPLKDKHQYWLGALLLSLEVILIVSSLTLNIAPVVSQYLLIVIAMMLFWYSISVRVYKKRYVLIIENTFLLNLILLFVGLQYGISRSALMTLSLSIAFLEFCGIVCCNTITFLINKFGCANICPAKFYEHYRNVANGLQYEDLDNNERNEKENGGEDVLDDNCVRETLLDV